MNIVEANIEITRSGEKLTSISVLMPVWSKPSEFDGNTIVKLPLLAIETIAKDDQDAEKAIEEALKSFCIAAEKHGQGLEKELQALGWSQVDQAGKPVLGFNVTDTDAVIDRLIQTGDNYVNERLEIAYA